MSEKITEVDGIVFSTSSELEQWRVDTLYTKEPETIAWIDHCIDRYKESTGVFFDIGANIGIYSLYTAMKANNIKVFSFEPVLNNYISLSKNILLNKLENISAFRLAISNKTTLIKLYIKDIRPGNSGAQINEPLDETGTKFSPLSIEQILSFTLDDLSKYDFPIPNFIKIDIDGQEENIFSGASNILQSKDIYSILCEFNSLESAIRTENLLQTYGFTPHTELNTYINHSTTRREKKGSTARNIIFSRKNI